MEATTLREAARMSLNIKEVREMQAEGRRLGRAGLSERVIDLVKSFDGESYKDAMALAGRMRVICAAASYDDYWREQVQKGEARELADIKRTSVGADSKQ
jgi:hypothetical protein